VLRSEEHRGPALEGGALEALEPGRWDDLPEGPSFPWGEGWEAEASKSRASGGRLDLGSFRPQMTSRGASNREHKYGASSAKGTAGRLAS